MVNYFSRNTRLENHSDEPLKVTATVDRIFQLLDDIIIQPGEHSYISYADLGIDYSGGRLVEVLFYLGDRQTEPILTSQIRDHAKIIFFKREDGTIAHNLIQGSMIQMNGMVISMKGAVKKMKSFLK
ncbi:uncharacterized protein LOC122307756 [Carya illinoinensis]|uniref:Uncharacterized protein n=1 Tax=Carya illinoinensis TaxID=32201 RepID=A0A922FDU8_CARIL|nr:uncharacterized protein LOC122307756 [Carya illinoinensis]XP_042976772.1 uncharacterized protein LOC122307756 [Carya illinoinensis]KAG6718735.1 hypothetical protein I3842_04G167300 [Carya illinoinensis]